jgi:F420-dependent oxidoreductase-like protein
VRLRVLMEPRHGATYEQILALARTTEEADFDGFFRGDHYLGIDAADPSYLPTDSWTTLAGLAVQTSRVRLGTLVTAGTFRQPGQLAIIAATVDAMSGGRVELGIGAGWYEREHLSFGIGFPPLGERFDRLEEQLSVITGLWTTPRGERFSYAGKHYRLDECANFPAPAHDLEAGPGARRHPRIIIGGGGPRRTPALAARFADEFNTGLGLGDGLAERFGYFRRVVAENGRDPATIRLSTTLPVCCGATRAEAERRATSLGEPGARLLSQGVVGVPRDVLDRLGQLSEAGIDTVYFHLYDVDDLDHVRLLGQEVLPRAR